MLWLNILLALAIMYVLFGSSLGGKLKIPGGVKPKASGGEWTVYGTNGCGWTRKQLTYLDEKGISYKYIECDKEDCGDVKAFPTMKHSDGTVVTGFKEL